jgi:hypothetical protein
MARAGIPDEFRRRIVGHSTTGVHDGYTNIDLARLKEGDRYNPVASSFFRRDPRISRITSELVLASTFHF